MVLMAFGREAGRLEANTGKLPLFTLHYIVTNRIPGPDTPTHLSRIQKRFGIVSKRSIGGSSYKEPPKRSGSGKEATAEEPTPNISALSCAWHTLHPHKLTSRRRIEIRSILCRTDPSPNTIAM